MKNYNKSGTIYDGQIYQAGEEIPDLGSWDCVSVQGGKRFYHGLSQDVEKLPTYVGGGCVAVCVDTGEVYRFHEVTKKWYLMQSSGGSSEGGPIDGGDGLTHEEIDDMYK